MLAVNQPHQQDAAQVLAAIDLSFPSLYALRADIEAVRDEVAQAAGRQRRAELAQPHVSDIIAAFRGGLDDAARDYEQKIARFAINPDPAAVPALLGPDAAVYFMRELVASKLPAIIGRVCPEAARGQGQDDRRASIQDATRRTDAVWEKLDGIQRRLSIEAGKLRQQRQEFYQSLVRADIEREERRLHADVEEVRRLQASLRNRSTPAAAARA